MALSRDPSYINLGQSRYVCLHLLNEALTMRTSGPHNAFILYLISFPLHNRICYNNSLSLWHMYPEMNLHSEFGYVMLHYFFYNFHIFHIRYNSLCLGDNYAVCAGLCISRGIQAPKTEFSPQGVFKASLLCLALTPILNLRSTLESLWCNPTLFPIRTKIQGVFIIFKHFQQIFFLSGAS